ncbi:hypothetical protein IJI17_01060 [Candidatus Saccharibacteria bacterium]|nr:hypothetical protein [Candidatus Saccharibacteria bacterium]MBR0062007.1 hypothetical protein [Selenomonadaceae bacterium]
MADTVTSTYQVQYDLQLKRADGDIQNRTVTFDTVREYGQNLANDVKNVAISIYGGPYDWIIQPTNWRDNDVNEEAYQVDKVEAKLITKTTNNLDLGI